MRYHNITLHLLLLRVLAGRFRGGSPLSSLSFSPSSSSRVFSPRSSSSARSSMRRSHSSAFSGSDSDDSSPGRKSSVILPVPYHREGPPLEFIGSHSFSAIAATSLSPSTPIQGCAVPAGRAHGTTSASAGGTGTVVASAAPVSAATVLGATPSGAGAFQSSSRGPHPPSVASSFPVGAVMIGGVALLGAEAPPRRVVDLVGTGAVGLPPSHSPLTNLRRLPSPPRLRRYRRHPVALPRVRRSPPLRWVLATARCSRRCTSSLRSRPWATASGRGAPPCILAPSAGLRLR